ncbi:MAG: HlyD family secretion protein [Actinomycetota bacterium]
MKQWTKRAIALIVVVFAVLLAIGVSLLSRNREPLALNVTGIIDGTEVNLSSKVAGKISRISCNEGDTVQAGQVVITLESDDINASVKQAMAGVERAKADVKVAESSIENGRANVLAAEAEVGSAAADLEKAGAQVEESRRQADRREDLFKMNLIAKESRDQMVSEYAVNVAAYDSSKGKLNAARSRKDVAAGQLNAAIGQWNASKAALKEAEANLAFFRSKFADTSIVAPVTGTVIFKALETGEMVSPGAAILTIVDLHSLYARVDIDETKIGKVVLNDNAVIRVEGVPGKTFEGRVSEIGRYGEFATQRDVVRGREDIKTFRVKVRVDDPTGMLKPGMTVDVEIPGKH